MRIALFLRHNHKQIELPANINHPISSMIYEVLERSSKEYSKRLHDEGYRLEKKKFKLFTFSPLTPLPSRKWTMINNGIMTTDSRQLRLIVSSVKNEFMALFLKGLFANKMVTISDVRFSAEIMTIYDSPEITNNMSFIPLSPIVCSRKNDKSNKEEYVLHDDKGFESLVFKNLCEKYEVLYGKPYSSGKKKFKITFDKPYLKRQKKADASVQKLRTIKEGTDGETRIKGTLAPFRIQAPKKLIQIGYDCGFGKENSQGFGMVKVDTSLNR